MNKETARITFKGDHPLVKLLEKALEEDIPEEEIMEKSKLEDIHIEVVENGWLVEVDREDEQTTKHVFERQEDVIRFIDDITGGINDVLSPVVV